MPSAAIALQSTARVYPHHKDYAKYMAVAREGHLQFRQVIATERLESAALGRGKARNDYPGFAERTWAKGQRHAALKKNR